MKRPTPNNAPTMTVGELKAFLSHWPDDMAVLASWEGIYTPFEPENFVQIEPRRYVTDEPALVIDVE